MKTPVVGVLDCGSGNLRSVSNAIIQGKGLPQISTHVDPDWEGLVLPGVGAFGYVMRNVGGLTRDLLGFLDDGKPFLGICLGLQVLFESSEESPDRPGLGLMKGRVTRVEATKVPHMGWNSIQLVGKSPLFEGVRSGDYFYFVHSYAARPDEDVVAATCEYEGREIVSAVGRGNVHACQFHPEKSGRIGLRIIRNFVNMSGGGR